MNDFDTRLGTALRDRVAEVHPDLDHLVAASTRAGVRIRMQRRIGVSLAAAAGVALVAVGAALVTGGNSPRPAGDAVGFAAEPSATATSTVAPTPSTPATPATPGTESAPFTVTAPAWNCTEPRDEKLDCSKGADAVHLIWRDAASHAAYAAGGPDKSADWVSAVHRGVFVTVDGPGAREVGESIRWVRATH